MANIQRKLACTTEVVAVLAAAVFVFRWISASAVRAWEVRLSGGTSFFWIEYAAIAILVVSLLRISRRNFTPYGITFNNLRYLLSVTAASFLPFLILGGILSLVNWRMWQGALIASLASVGTLMVTALVLRHKTAPGQRILSAILILVPSAFITHTAPLAEILGKTLYFYLLVGPSEELLFRGYIQSRLSQAWGKPFLIFDVPWGWGTITTALLFGMWHVLLMPAAPGVWYQALWTSFAGLAFGYLREKSGSILPSSLLHSIMNYLPFSELLAN